MSDDKKSIDPGLSAERNQPRDLEAKEAIADHEEAQRALHVNRRSRNVCAAAKGPFA
jgi:hypothetical protein